MNKNFRLISILLLPLSILINFIASKFPYLIEKYYSLTFNKFIIKNLSKISYLVPFSLYEAFMYILVICLLLVLLRFIYIALNNPNNIKNFLKKLFLNFLSLVSIAYFLFIILWGLNYNRLPLSTTLVKNYEVTKNAKISNTTYSINDLRDLYKYLISQTNNIRKSVKKDKNNIMKSNTDYKGIINRASIGYENIQYIIPSVSGNYSNAKYIKSSNLMCYTGITGIYFPFTFESNVNIAIPDLYIPSTVIHEMAHMRGFASEDEANFIAYLASINHADYDFKYSGYILALNYTASQLKKSDYKSYEELTKTISTDVLNDLKNNSDFWSKYNGPIDKLSNKFNDTYLKSNGVNEGTDSYGHMVNLLLLYYKLYPSY